ncbi:hypothetical protein C6A85_000000113915, partial [Mycobacterium sp. ITM-2017-0098]
PFMPVGADPLSAAIIGQIPAIELPIETQLPLIKAQSTATARNVTDAAQMYLAADERNGAAISQQMQTLPTAVSPRGGGSAPPAAAGADSMSQMMGMPMQMAGQMAQMPMQMMGAVAAVPQGAMQGVQQAGQQVQQMVGQFGQGGTGNQSETSEGGATPAAEQSGDQRAESLTPDNEDRKQEGGAASGRPEDEVAPQPEGTASESSSPTTPPGRHRAAEPDDGINL